MEYDRIRRKGNDYSVFFFDTETHNDTELVDRLAYQYANGVRPLDSSGVGVWLWYCISTTSEDYRLAPHGCRLGSFFDWMEARRQNENLLIYDFNLAFETSYLVPWMLRNGFSYAGNRDKSFEMVCNESRSSVYSIRIKWNDHVCIFKDRHKRIPGGSLRQLAKDYNLRIQKSYINGDEGDEGYKKRRRIPNYVPTEQEKYYCWADCKVCAELYALKVDEYNETIKDHPFVERVEKGKIVKTPTEKTDEYKDFFLSSSSASYACKRRIRETYPTEVFPWAKGKFKRVKRRKQFREEFPKLGDTRTGFIRHSYEGGLCYPTAWVRGKDLGTTLIGHADVVSQYPSQIICRKKFPFGRPEWVSPEDVHEEEGYRYLLQIKYRYDKVKRIPSLKMTGVAGIWYSDFDDIEDDINEFTEQVRGELPPFLYVWDFFIPTLKRCLEGFDYKVVKARRFKAKPAPFAPYFLEHFNLKNKYKKEHLAAKKRGEKLLINQPTGKFGEKPHNENFVCKLGSGGYPVREASLRQDEEDNAMYTYVPFISAVTAYAREFLLRTANYLGFENICYMDTDSLMFFWNKETEAKSKNPELFGSTLMHFEQDEIWTECFFAKPKTYRYTNVETRKHDRKTGGCHEPNYDELKDKLCGNEDGSTYAYQRERMVNTPRGKVRIPVTHEFGNRKW